MGVALTDPTGKIVEAEPDRVSGLLNAGYKRISTGQELSGLSEEANKAPDTLGGKIGAGVAGLARGATLGGSDLLLKGITSPGIMEDIAKERAAHPYISGASELTGALAPIALSGGTAAPEALGSKILAASPTALTAKLGSRIVGMGEGAGLAKAVGYGAAGAATEGALQNAGAYVSDVALGDRNLSAEGFLGAMEKGALWGGIPGGALTLGERGLIAARRLLPSQEVTRQAVEKAEAEAAHVTSSHIQDGEALEQAATDRLRELRNIQGAADPSLAQKVTAAEQRTLNEQLQDQLAKTKQRLDQGESLEGIRKTPTKEPEPISLSKAPSEQPGYGAMAEVHTKAEQAAFRELAANSDPWSEASTLVKKLEALRDSREMMKQWTQGRTVGAAVKGNVRSIGDEVLDAASPQKLEKAIATHGAEHDADLVEAAHALATHEDAAATLAETLGPRAPSSALDHAAEFRRTVEDQQAKVADAAAEAADKLHTNAVKQGEALNGAEAKTPPKEPPKKSGLLGKAMHVAEGYEALHMAGVPLPDPAAIPIVGPIAKVFLKARVISKIFRRGKGLFEATADAGVASKAAQTRQRVMGAIDSALGIGAKVVAKAQPVAPTAAALLGHKLFDDGQKREEPKNITDAFRARADEISAATPQAIKASIDKLVPANDPSIRAAISETMQRQLAFLNDKLPKPDAIRGILGGNAWQPSPAEMDNFAKYVNGATNPADVIERATRGDRVSAQEVEAVKAVYPSLFAEAQRRLIEGTVKDPKSISYARRVQLSLLFDLPLTTSMSPGYASWSQANFTPKTGGGMGGAPAAAAPSMLGTPTIKGPINTGARLMPRMDKE